MQHLQRIFPLHSEWLQKNNHFKDELHLIQGYENSLCLLWGAHINMLKTSLLFQASVSYSHEGKQVAFVCAEPFQKMPLSVHGMPQPNPEIMKHLKILYMSNPQELQKYLATVHMMRVPPDILIISDIQKYAAQGKVEDTQHTLARLLALLVDAANFLKEKSNGDFQALVSCSDGNLQNKAVYDRYIPGGFEIEKVDTDVFQCSRWWKRERDLKITFEHHDEELFLSKLLCNSEKT